MTIPPRIALYVASEKVQSFFGKSSLIYQGSPTGESRQVSEAAEEYSLLHASDLTPEFDRFVHPCRARGGAAFHHKGGADDCVYPAPKLLGYLHRLY
jgi:hypothetical protein